jgi:hypothetical protein
MADPRRRPKEPWHAVSIVPRGGACEQSIALREKRFLSKEAPPIPLSDCPRKQSCTCVYKHYADRRAGPRRMEEERDGVRMGRPQVERRGGRGRRREDGER